jgi:uncharacterized protein (TIGR03437 family)
MAGTLRTHGLTVQVASQWTTRDSRIRSVSTSGMITTVAGSGAVGYSGDGGPAAAAQLNYPGSVAVDSAGNLYIVTQNRVRKVSPDGIITTVAGNGAFGYSGDGGLATAAQLSGLWGMAVDSDGNLYISDAFNNQRLRKVSPARIITTVAGNGTSNYGGDGGPAAGAQVNFRCCQMGGGMALDREGGLYIADTWNNRVRKVSANGIITTVAGNGSAGYSGDGGPAISAQLALPMALAVDNAGDLYIADTWNFRIRKISRAGIIATVAGNGTAGHSGDGAEAINAQIGYSFGVTVDTSGTLYIANLGYIRKVSPNGIITTVVDFSGSAGPAGGTQMGTVLAVAVDSAGNLYFTDHGHDRVLKLSPSGVIATVAGNGMRGYSGDDGPANEAQIATPVALAVDSADNLYIGEWGDSRIRKVSPAGIISTIAGDGTYGYSGDGGPATSAEIGFPSGLAVGIHGEIYVADSQNAIRLLQMVTSTISVNIIANVASYFSGPVAPGEMVAIGGFGLGPTQLVSAAPASDGSYAPQLAGTSVLFNGVAAPLVFTSATQVKAIVPYSISSGIAEVAVSYQGQISRPFSIRVATSAPGIFTQDSSGMGPAVAFNPDGSTNTATNPVKAGDVISLFATGLGQSRSALNVTIGGEATSVISVDSRLAGVVQLRVRITAGIQAGTTVPVIAQAGQMSSPDVTLAVQ